MVIVRPLFAGDAYRTEVWISDDALAAIEKYVRKKENPRGFLLKKLKHYAMNGFENYVGSDKPIRHEWDGVYRIGHDNNLFRVLGFFDGRGDGIFISADAYLKRGQDLSAADRRRINAVARIKAEGTWRKASDDD